MTETSTTLFRFTMARPATRVSDLESIALRPKKTTQFEEQIISAYGTSAGFKLADFSSRYLTSANAINELNENIFLISARSLLAQFELLVKSPEVTAIQIESFFNDANWAKLITQANISIIEDRFWSTLIAMHLTPAGNTGTLLALSRALRVLLISAEKFIDTSVKSRLEHFIKAPLALPIDRIKKTYPDKASKKPNTNKTLFPSLKNSLEEKQIATGKNIIIYHNFANKLRRFSRAPETQITASSIKNSKQNLQLQSVRTLTKTQYSSLSPIEKAFVQNEGGTKTPIEILLTKVAEKIQFEVNNLDASTRGIKKQVATAVSYEQQNKMHLMALVQVSDNPLTPDIISVLAKLNNSVLFNFLPGFIIDSSEINDRQIESLRPGVRPLGVMDLKLVSTTLKYYQLGEIAHIENVLATEYRKRSHSRQELSESSTTSETETTQERQHDLETSERYALHQEVQHSVNEQMQVTAGVQVSGYGPGFSVGVNAGFSYNRGEQFAEKQSSDIAKEIVDKTRERIETRVREQRQSLRRVTVNEDNVHRFDNTGPDSTHKVGIYRFVDQVLEARLINYGRRIMFEFMVPEPGAALRVLEAQSSAKPEKLPELVTLPSEIDEANYQDLAGLYNARNVEPPPELKITLTALLKENESAASGDANALSPVTLSAEIDLPQGYKVERASIVRQTAGGDVSTLHITESAAGENRHTSGGVTSYLSSGASSMGIINKLAAWVLADPAKTAIATVYITCERMESHWRRWQSDTYAKIKEAYEIKLDDIAEKNRQLQAKQRRGIGVSNPAQNRRIERDELTRSCVSLFNHRLLSENYFDSLTISDAGFSLNVDDAMREGQVVRFFHSAFEWDNMTYELFPYFWGNRSRWEQMQLASHEDPKFEEFLRSGFARVLVPVRPGQEANLLNALSVGLRGVFDGARETVVDDPDFLELLSEVDAELNPPVQEGDSWDVVVPTSLIKLQLTGEEGTLGISGTA